MACHFRVHSQGSRYLRSWKTKQKKDSKDLCEKKPNAKLHENNQWFINYLDCVKSKFIKLILGLPRTTGQLVQVYSSLKLTFVITAWASVILLLKNGKCCWESGSSVVCLPSRPWVQAPKKKRKINCKCLLWCIIMVATMLQVAQ
jgi:hypothetical protein